MINHSKSTIGASEAKALTDCLKSGWLAQGKYVRRFEQALSRYIGTRDAVATNSGTSALHLALLSLGIKSGDEVILPSYLCTSVLNAVNYVGAKPVIVDINEDDFNISLAATRRNLTRRTKAIIVVHQFGFPTDIKSFLRLGVPVIEDCAQAIGAKINNRRVGSLGTLAIYSFYATKMLATGYGGMVSSNDRGLINKIKDLRDFDERDNYITRYNYQMSDLVAAMGIEQLKRLNEFVRRRQYIARVYSRRFKGISCQLPRISKGTNPAFFRYVIRVRKSLSSFIKAMKRKGIETKRPIYKPLHRYLGLNKASFPNTEKAYGSAISLPIYPTLIEGKARYVGRVIREILS